MRHRSGCCLYMRHMKKSMPLPLLEHCWRDPTIPADWLHTTHARMSSMQGRSRPPPSELIFPPADTAADRDPSVQVPQSQPAENVASRKQQGGSGLEAGIRWPLPDESPPFWERPARTEPAPLQSGDPVRLLIAHPMQACWDHSTVSSTAPCVAAIIQQCHCRDLPVSTVQASPESPGSVSHDSRDGAHCQGENQSEAHSL